MLPLTPIGEKIKRKKVINVFTEQHGLYGVLFVLYYLIDFQKKFLGFLEKRNH